MGRASRRKRDRRRSPSAERARLTEQQLGIVVETLRALVEDGERRSARHAEAARQWWPGDPAPTPAPAYPAGSLGYRLFSDTLLASLLEVPSLGQAAVPSAKVIRGDPAQWTVAGWVLARAAVLDGLGPDDPDVASLLEVLGPVARRELSARTGPEEAAGAEGRADAGGLGPDAFDDDGPVLVIGAFCLVHATWTAIGNDRIAEVLDALAAALERPLPGRGQAVATALVRAFAGHYRCEREDDVDLLERIGGPGHGDAVTDLVASGAVDPDEALGVGLVALQVVGRACMSDAESLVAASAGRHS